jgi:hypothetical protein
MAAINESLRLYQDTYNDEGYASINHLSKAMLHESDLLTPIVTHLYYSDKEHGRRNFPMTFYTEGMNQRKAVKTVSYKLPVIGRPKKTTTVAKTLHATTDTPGKGFGEFTIAFRDRLFSVNQIIHSSNKNIQVQVKAQPKKQGDYYLYTVKMIGQVSSTSYVPVTPYLLAGAVWARGVVKVSFEFSKGTEHRSMNPGMMTNQLSLVRDTYQIRGNIENKTMVFQIPTPEGIKKYWCEWEMFQRNLDWMEKCEMDLWYSLYNKDENGEINDIDPDSGEVIPMGAGILQQIPNSDTYSFLTEEKITQVITDVFYNASDSDQVKIKIFTGTGGRREAHNAMKGALQSLGFTINSDNFVQGNTSLTYGAYFTTFRHIDGHVVDWVAMPMFDRGAFAEAADKHPITGMSLEGYNMYFIDMSTYQGEANVQYLYEEGNDVTQFVVAGAKVPKGYEQTVFRATDRDGSSVQWMKSQGVIIKRPTNCFKLECVLS